MEEFSIVEDQKHCPSCFYELCQPELDESPGGGAEYGR